MGTPMDPDILYSIWINVALFRVTSWVSDQVLILPKFNGRYLVNHVHCILATTWQSLPVNYTFFHVPNFNLLATRSARIPRGVLRGPKLTYPLFCIFLTPQFQLDFLASLIFGTPCQWSRERRLSLSELLKLHSTRYPLRYACGYICRRGVPWRCMGRRSVIRYNRFLLYVPITDIILTF